MYATALARVARTAGTALEKLAGASDGEFREGATCHDSRSGEASNIIPPLSPNGNVYSDENIEVFLYTRPEAVHNSGVKHPTHETHHTSVRAAAALASFSPQSS